MSTVKVDTIQTTGGVSEIAIDKLKGVSSANSISVVGEGGSTTTNLQQGLCKAWVMADSDASLEDSFNISSPTDVSTGTYTFSLTNAMAAVDRYSQSGCGRGGTDNVVMTRNTAGDTASVIGVEMSIGDTSALTDHPVDVQIVGDLA